MRGPKARARFPVRGPNAARFPVLGANTRFQIFGLLLPVLGAKTRFPVLGYGIKAAFLFPKLEWNGMTSEGADRFPVLGYGINA